MDKQELAEDILERMLGAVTEARRVDMEADPRHQRLSSTGHCLRQQWYDIVHGPGMPGPDALLEMNDGNLHEADVKRWLRDGGLQVRRAEDVDGKNEGEEVTLWQGSYRKLATGHIDGDLALDDEHLGILEAKSMGYLRFLDLIEKGLRQSHPDYWDQAQGYMAADQKERVALVAKAKDSGAVRGALRKRKAPLSIHEDVAVSPQLKLAVQIIEFDPESAARVYDRHERLNRAIELDLPPDREYTKSDWHCRYCNHNKECWG